MTNPNTGNNLVTCIQMYDFLLNKMDAGSRSQVKATMLPQIEQGLITSQTIVTDNQFLITITDLLDAIDVIKKSGVTYLTAEMKTSIVEGINSIRATMCEQAYKFYCENDFTPTEQTIPVYRGIVKTCLETGVIRP